MTFKVYLKVNDKIFINGAVLRVDRKTTIEFLNDVSFLLESQIIQPEQADTPLKQLYYVVQIMLMSPNDTDAALAVYRGQMPTLMETFTSPKINNELKDIDRLVHEKSFHTAMKSIRELFKIEAAILSGETSVMANTLKSAADVMRRADTKTEELKTVAR
ncbi:MAG: flagellar biosynthesis repressor FlbT [Rhizobiaceae bacterium]